MYGRSLNERSTVQKTCAYPIQQTEQRYTKGLFRIIFPTMSFQVIYPALDAVFHYQMKHREESSKYDAQRSIFDELRGVSSVNETLCRMLDITSQTK